MIKNEALSLQKHHRLGAVITIFQAMNEIEYIRDIRLDVDLLYLVGAELSRMPSVAYPYEPPR
jgi:hypothetical protein